MPKNDKRDVLFISHANPEDNNFALWLTLRLAAEGYAVWCDLTELLGGEDFWKEIENVLRDRAVKFLFVTSHSSTKKDGVLQELAEAKEVAKEWKLQDFVIPLHIDNCKTNIEIKRLNYIPFENSWSKGLAQLLKKLEKEGIPKSDSFGPSSVSAWWKEHYSSESGLVDEAEALFSNWFPISGIPEKIFVHVFQPGYSRALLLSNSKTEIPTREHANGIITFASSTDFPNSESIFWKSQSYTVGDLLLDKYKDTFIDSKTFNLTLVDLIRQAWETRLTGGSLDLFEIASGDQCGYFTKDLIENDWARFDIAGFKGRRQVVGYRTMKTKDASRKRFWHFGVSGRVYLRRKHYLAINPHVVFSNDGKTIWDSADRMHKAKMNQCSDWWNHHWRDRILATMAFLSDNGSITLNLASDQTCEINLEPICFTSPVLFHDPTNSVTDFDETEQDDNTIEEFDDEDEWN